jgi:Ankyrin repeats (3 copies)
MRQPQISTGLLTNPATDDFSHAIVRSSGVRPSRPRVPSQNKPIQATVFALQNLPPDALQGIANFLLVHETVRLRKTCRALRDVPLGPRGVTADHAVRAVEVRNRGALRELIRIAPSPRAMIWAAFRGDIQSLNILMPLFDPTFNDSQALGAAVESGSLECCARLLPFSKPLARKSSAFRTAAALGHLAIVHLLAPFSNHADLDSDALRSAAAAGHADVVRFLLTSGLSEPTVRDSVALRHAARDGHIEIVTMLRPFSTQPNALTAALREAAARGHTEIVAELLPFCDATTENSIALRKAAAGGHGDVVQLLLPLSDSKAKMCDSVQPLLRRLRGIDNGRGKRVSTKTACC